MGVVPDYQRFGIRCVEPSLVSLCRFHFVTSALVRRVLGWAALRVGPLLVLALCVSAVCELALCAVAVQLATKELCLCRYVYGLVSIDPEYTFLIDFPNICL